MADKKYIGHAELVSQICAQFVFMQLMTTWKYIEISVRLNQISIDKIRDDADDYFMFYADRRGIIPVKLLALRIDNFLKPYSHLTDICAIRQNIMNYIDRK